MYHSIDSLEANETVSHTDAPFPMVVFLRGDEPYFSDFCWNADQVMELLGIRRSRLNQISGKELRVGRTRIDSYVRPVYRKQDVEEYLKWIRPTASHKKSSDLLNEARSKLEEQSDRLSEHMTSKFESLMESFTWTFQKQFLEQRQFSKSMLTLMQKTLKLNLRSLLQRFEFQQKQYLSDWTELRENFQHIKSLRKTLEQMLEAQVQMTSRLAYTERTLQEMQSGQKILQQNFETIQKDLESLKDTLCKKPSPLPIVRNRRGQGLYARSRHEADLRRVQTSLENETGHFVPAWKRKKLSSKAYFKT